MLLVTFTPDDAFARGGMRREREVTVAERSQFEDTGGAVAVRGGRYGYGGYGYRRYGVGAAAVGAGGVRRRSVRLRRGPTTAAAAATTLTETGFARTGITRTERRDAVGLWCSKRMMK